jgi:small-conductance mechanosensitive channel
MGISSGDGARRAGIVLALAAITLLLLPSILAEPAGSVRVLNKNASYDREVIAGEKASAEWTVYNSGNISSYNVRAAIEGSYGTWDLSVTPQTFTISPDSVQEAAIHFASKKSNLGESYTINVRFNITEISSGTTPSTYELSKNVTFTVVAQKTTEKRGLELFGHSVGLPSYLDNNPGRFLIMVLIWLIVGSIARYAVIPLMHYIASKTETKYDDIILDIIKVPTLLLIVMYGLVDSLSQLQLDELTLAWIFRAYYIGLILVLAYVIYRIFKGVLIVWLKAMAKKTHTELDVVLVPIFEKIGTVVIVIIAAIFLLNYFGVNVTVFVAGLGVAGLVVAFAAQDTLSNFFAGIFLLLDRPFVHGDTIIIENGDYCEVLHVGLRSTRLYDIFTQDLNVVPNNKLASANIVNVSKPNPREKVTVEIGVSLDGDLDKAEHIMLDVAARHPNVDKAKENEPVARLSSFGESGMEYKLFFTVDHWNNRWRVAHEMRKEILKRFRAEGIEIPFPQTVVRLKKD